MNKLKEIKIQSTKINIDNKLAILSYLFTGLNILLITILFIINLQKLMEKQIDENITSEEIENIKNQTAFLIVSYIFNSIFDIVFVLYVFRSVEKRQIGYVFVIFWFIIWCLFSVGVMFVNNIHLAPKLLNLIIGIGNTLILFSLFYKLQYRKREIQYEKLKKRKSI